MVRIKVRMEDYCLAPLIESVDSLGGYTFNALYDSYARFIEECYDKNFIVKEATTSSGVIYSVVNLTKKATTIETEVLTVLGLKYLPARLKEEIFGDETALKYLNALTKVLTKHKKPIHTPNKPLVVENKLIRVHNTQLKLSSYILDERKHVKQKASSEKISFTEPLIDGVKITPDEYLFLHTLQYGKQVPSVPYGFRKVTQKLGFNDNQDTAAWYVGHLIVEGKKNRRFRDLVIVENVTQRVNLKRMFTGPYKWITGVPATAIVSSSSIPLLAGSESGLATFILSTAMVSVAALTYPPMVGKGYKLLKLSPEGKQFVKEYNAWKNFSENVKDVNSYTKDIKTK